MRGRRNRRWCRHWCLGEGIGTFGVGVRGDVALPQGRDALVVEAASGLEVHEGI